MKFAQVAVAACLPGLAAASSPIAKVLEMISDLQQKVIHEGEASVKVFEEYSEWVEDRNRELKHDIDRGTELVQELTAKIASAKTSSASFSAEVEQLAADIAKDEGDLAAETKVRNKETADFKQSEADLVETISMLERATAILEREMSKGDASLIQAGAQNVAQAFSALVTASMMSSADANKLTSLIQGSASDMDVGAPAAAVYTSQSGGIVETLQNLQETAEAQLSDARKTEMTNLHNYQMLEQSLKDEIRFANQDKANAQRGVSDSDKAKATAEGDLATTKATLDADTKTRNQLHRDAMGKAQDFEAEKKSRGEELQALAEAKKVISEQTGGADAFQYKFAQVNFLQTQSSLKSSTDLAHFEVVRIVRDLARKDGSSSLAQLARRLASAIRSSGAASEDPFAKIKGLITDMIDKLTDEANADSSKKQYCDKELSETTEKRDEKSGSINKLTSQIDVMKSRSASLKTEVAELQDSLAKLAAAQSKMIKLRRSEHDAFTKNKADLEQGLKGVAAALKILSEYYAKTETAHTSAKGAGSSIIGLLEVVESDLTKSLAEVQSTEDSAAADHESETKDNEVDKTMKTKDVEHKTSESVSLDKEISELSNDRSGVQAELDAVLEYFARIKQECTDVAMTYEERKRRREAEIAGLKEALTVLESETAFVQRRTKHRRVSQAVLSSASLRGAIA